MFRFRLQKLMELRRLTRDQRRVELAQAYEAEQLLRQQQEAVQKELDQLRTAMRQATRPGEVAVDRLLGAHRYELLLRGQLRLLAQRSSQVAQEVDRRRQSVVEADKEFRVIERLREKLESRYRQEAAKQEQRQLDEIALIGSQRTEGV